MSILALAVCLEDERRAQPTLSSTNGGTDMGKLTVFENETLDGVAQAPARPDEDRRGGFEHGGWGVPYADEVAALDQFHAADGRPQRSGGAAEARGRRPDGDREHPA